MHALRMPRGALSVMGIASSLWVVAIVGTGALWLQDAAGRALGTSGPVVVVAIVTISLVAGAALALLLLQLFAGLGWRDVAVIESEPDRASVKVARPFGWRTVHVQDVGQLRIDLLVKKLDVRWGLVRMTSERAIIEVADGPRTIAAWGFAGTNKAVDWDEWAGAQRRALPGVTITFTDEREG